MNPAQTEGKWNMAASKPTVASLAQDVAALTQAVTALAGAVSGDAPKGDAPKGSKPSRRSGSKGSKPAGKLALAEGSTFEYLKGRKGSRKRWTTYTIAGSEDGRYLAVQLDSDSGFVSKWHPDRVDESLPYVRNIRPA